LEAVSKALVVLLVVDRSSVSADDIAAQIAELNLRADQRMCIVANKIDVDNKHPLPIANHPLIALSAKSGENLDALREWLSGAVDTSALEAGAAVISGARHYEALMRAGEAIDRVSAGLSAGVSAEGLTEVSAGAPADLLAEDLREALHHIGTITGIVTSDDILGTIFSKFCIGK
jgi:tRNA modification GTPase